MYGQVTPTTGILMYGNMSVGMVTIEITSSMAISSAITMKVYGRRSASLAIDIYLSVLAHSRDHRYTQQNAALAARGCDLVTTPLRQAVLTEI